VCSPGTVLYWGIPVYQCGQLDLSGCEFVLSTKRIKEVGEELLLSDDFTDRRREGTVIGSTSTSGHKRLGVDIERTLSIDNGALRIAPAIEAGFGRTALAYGPCARKAGLTFAVYMTNGHNTSQAEPLSDTFRTRMTYWFKGSATDARCKRLVQWLLSRRVLRSLRQFRRWRRTAKDKGPVPMLDENLAIGWMPNESVIDPRLVGSGFIMHALGPENGELWTGGAGSRSRPLRGVQNVPIYYVGVTREQGTVFYVCSVDGVAGMPAYPWLRPVGIDATDLPETVYVGIHQSVLGQIGWRLDSRVYGVRVAHVQGYESWCGGAHVADRLVTDDVQTGMLADKGGEWRVWTRQPCHCSYRPAPSYREKFALLEPGAASGLLHATVATTSESSAKIGILWRYLDQRNHWRLELSSSGCEIVLVSGGICETIAFREFVVSRTSSMRLQVLDDGVRLMAYIDGQPLLDKWLRDSRFQEASQVGIYFYSPEQEQTVIHAFEAHPRQVKLPTVLEMGVPWFRKGTETVVADDFAGDAGDLDNRPTSSGGKRWHRLIGDGVIEVTGGGAARVRASAQEPCPGRTAYCVDWPHADFVDMEVTITPPGKQRGEKERTTAGFILYQDPSNYVTLNVYRSDYYPAGSTSTFFKFGGFEDVYDAVWSNVADRVNYGQPLRLRLCCDGERYLVFINDETVLFRAFRDVYPNVEKLMLRKVGILANWEFGTDTGSTFEQFILRV
jgi:hypothetical protein